MVTDDIPIFEDSKGAATPASAPSTRSIPSRYERLQAREERRRPQYETGTDLEREKFVADRLMEQSKITLEKLPASYGPDFFHPSRIVEVKCRKHAHDRFETLILALRKWQDGVYLSHLMRHAIFQIAVGFTDGIWTLEVAHHTLPDYEIKWGGRTNQPRDSADVEPVVHIPIVDMTRISQASPWDHVRP